jgi:hypothetical protein
VGWRWGRRGRRGGGGGGAGEKVRSDAHQLSATGAICFSK